MRWRDRAVAAVVGLVLCGLATAFASGGRRAIVTRHYQGRWESDGDVSIGPFGRHWHDEGVTAVDGPAAVRLGGAYLAVAAALAMWGGLFGLRSIGPRDWTPLRSRAGLAVVAASAAAGATAGVLPFPPTGLPREESTDLFYGVLAGVAVGLVVAVRTANPRVRRGAVAGVFGWCLSGFLSALVLPTPPVFGGLVGAVVTVVLAAHVALIAAACRPGAGPPTLSTFDDRVRDDGAAARVVSDDW